MKESSKIARAEDNVKAFLPRIQQLEDDFKTDTVYLAARIDPVKNRWSQYYTSG